MTIDVIFYLAWLVSIGLYRSLTLETFSPKIKEGIMPCHAIDEIGFNWRNVIESDR